MADSDAQTATTDLVRLPDGCDDIRAQEFGSGFVAYLKRDQSRLQLLVTPEKFELHDVRLREVGIMMALLGVGVVLSGYLLFFSTSLSVAASVGIIGVVAVITGVVAYYANRSGFPRVRMTKEALKLPRLYKGRSFDVGDVSRFEVVDEEVVMWANEESVTISAFSAPEQRRLAADAANVAVAQIKRSAEFDTAAFRPLTPSG